MSTILVDGRPREVHGIDCVLPEESGLAFRALPKRTETRAVVLHWTGGSGRAPQVYRTLIQRGLSVHFVIDPDGVVYQMADASHRCAHAGKVDDDDGDGVAQSANSATVGIEIVNPAGGISIERGVSRAVVIEEIHGRSTPHTTFTPEQIAAALALTEALCSAYGLPFLPPLKDRDVLATTMGEEVWRTFRGVCGHFHLTKRKRDPGLAILRAIVARAQGHEP